jgi:MIP family channel proteins
MNRAWRQAVAELVGTFAFFFIGAGSIVTDSYTRGAVGLIGIALAHGLILSVLVSALGPVSGGHFNPAVTIGIWVARKIEARTAGLYILAQLIGAALSGFALKAIFAEAVWAPVHLGTPSLAVGASPMLGIFVEALLTFFLLLAVLGTAVDSTAPKIGGFGIGLTVAADIIVGGPLTGAAMNPARVFGTALAAGFWDYHWVYWVGPILGAVVASWIYSRLISETL